MFQLLWLVSIEFCWFLFFFREITKMKQSRGAVGLPGADDDDFTVVPVESTSESTERLEFLKTPYHSCSTLSLLGWRCIEADIQTLNHRWNCLKSNCISAVCSECLRFSCCPGKKARILDAEGLALGCEIATSKKKARDLVDGSFHRSGPLVQLYDYIDASP